MQEPGCEKNQHPPCVYHHLYPESTWLSGSESSLIFTEGNLCCSSLTFLWRTTSDPFLSLNFCIKGKYVSFFFERLCCLLGFNKVFLLDYLLKQRRLLCKVYPVSYPCEMRMHKCNSHVSGGHSEKREMISFTTKIWISTLHKLLLYHFIIYLSSFNTNYAICPRVVEFSFEANLHWTHDKIIYAKIL